MPSGQDALRPIRAALIASAALCLGITAPMPAAAQSALASKSNGLAWASLTASQQSALAPLKSQWPEIDASRKSKWLVVAERYPTMGVEDQRRLQERMGEWSRLTPTQRAQTRMQFQETRLATPQEKRERWEQYQALSPEQKAALQSKASSTRSKPADTGSATDREALQRSAELVSGGVQTKPATVNGAAAAPRMVNPVVVQAKAGATTTLMNKAQPEPSRNQPPKPHGLLALPQTFDNRTLLPKDGAPPQRISKAREGASAPATTHR